MIGYIDMSPSKMVSGILTVTVICLLLCGRAVRVKGGDGEMVKIPAGWFIMGSDDGPKDAQPKHKVYLDAYYIDKFEVTNAQYKTYLDKKLKLKAEGQRVIAPIPNCKRGDPLTPEGAEQIWDLKSATYPEKYANYPVTCVAWRVAKFYCEDQGKLLPTEAQWEKAARGPDGLLYPWGNEWNPDFTNHGLSEAPWEDPTDGYPRLAPVGSFPKDVSVYGVYDLAGNAWEWTRDFYAGDYYTKGPKKNPPGPVLDMIPFPDRFSMYKPMYTRRGGSWAQSGERSVSYLRFPRPMAYNDDASGIRCVKGSR